MALSKIDTAAIAADAVTDAKIASSLGKVIKVSYASYDTAFSTTSNGVDTGLTVTHSVQDSNNKLYITASCLWAASSNTGYLAVTDGSNNIIERPAASGSRGRYHFGTLYGDSNYLTYNALRESVTLEYDPSSTGNHTFKVRAYEIDNGTILFNRNKFDSNRIYDPIGISTLTVYEVDVS